MSLNSVPLSPASILRVSLCFISRSQLYRELNYRHETITL